MRRLLKGLRKHFRYGEKGFTLIELLIVIAILGVLAAVVIPNVQRYTRSGQKAAAQQELETVQTAIDAAMAEAGTVALTVDIVVNAASQGGVGNVINGVRVEDFLRRTLDGRWQCDVDGGGSDGIISDGHYEAGSDGWTFVAPDTWTWQADPGSA